jgi:CHASE3 domain sensor protein
MVEIRRTWSKIAANLELERIAQMKWPTEKKIIIGFGVVLAVLLINALVSYRATRRLIDEGTLVAHTHEVLGELEATISTMKDAETGERGYIITGEARYLQPYEAAVEQISSHVARLQQLTADNPSQQARIPLLKQKVDNRLNSLKRGIALRQGGNVEGARQLLLSDEGKGLMDDLRQFVTLMENDETALLTQRSEEARASGRDAFLTDLIPNLIFVSCSY